jgi:uncharacterized membrane protein YfcA
MDVLIVLFGLGVGILVGTTGMGGGSIMTPLLILVVGTSPVTAIGTDLAYAAVTKTVGGWRHLKAKTVDMSVVLWLAAGSVPGALVGVWLLGRLEKWLGASFDKVILWMLAGALLLTAAAVLYRALFVHDAHGREVETFDFERPRSKTWTVVFGALIGVVLGTTSAGSGSLIAVGLIIAYRLTPIRVVGTDVAHAALLLWFAAAAHVFSGNVDFALAGNILVGSIPGVWLGVHLATRLPSQGLRPLLGVVLLAAGLSLIVKAGASIPPAAVLGLPLGVGALAFVIHRVRPPLEPAPAPSSP